MERGRRVGFEGMQFLLEIQEEGAVGLQTGCEKNGGRLADDLKVYLIEHILSLTISSNKRIAKLSRIIIFSYINPALFLLMFINSAQLSLKNSHKRYKITANSSTIILQSKLFKSSYLCYIANYKFMYSTINSSTFYHNLFIETIEQFN